MKSLAALGVIQARKAQAQKPGHPLLSQRANGPAVKGTAVEAEGTNPKKANVEKSGGRPPSKPSEPPDLAESREEIELWQSVAEAIVKARRGVHLAVTPELCGAWQTADVVTGHRLNSVQLCELARERGGAPMEAAD